MGINISDVVEAVNGRDAGKLFFVVGTEDGSALIADGAGRRIEKPKKKKFKHLKPVRAVGGETAARIAAGDRVTNGELKRALSGIREAPHEAEGGM